MADFRGGAGCAGRIARSAPASARSAVLNWKVPDEQTHRPETLENPLLQMVQLERLRQLRQGGSQLTEAVL
jgi:hypothetical protein